MPFNFQPFRLTVQATDVASDNGLPVELHVTLENLGTVAHCYDPDEQVPDMWSYPMVIRQSLASSLEPER